MTAGGKGLGGGGVGPESLHGLHEPWNQKVSASTAISFSKTFPLEDWAALQWSKASEWKQRGKKGQIYFFLKKTIFFSHKPYVCVLPVCSKLYLWWRVCGRIGKQVWTSEHALTEHTAFWEITNKVLFYTLFFIRCHQSNAVLSPSSENMWGTTIMFAFPLLKFCKDPIFLVLSALSTSLCLPRVYHVRETQRLPGWVTVDGLGWKKEKEKEWKDVIILGCDAEPESLAIIWNPPKNCLSFFHWTWNSGYVARCSLTLCKLLCH